MKSAKDYLDTANESVPRLTAEEAIERVKAGSSIVVDVRDSAAIAESGTIAGALRIPRGFIEFAADSTTAFHNEAMKKDADILLVCAAGGQAALAGKTLQDMGYTSVNNIGGISDWKDAGGAMED